MKALILYTNTGAGHVSAGKAICDALKKFNVDTVEIDTLAFAGKSTSKKVENIYVKTVKKSPKFFGLLYRAGEKISNPKIKSIIYILNTLYSKNIYNIIKKEKPDLIICTHIFCAQTISYLQKKYNFNAITAAIITDYTCAPFWEETCLNYYFIPHKDLITEFVKKGLDKNKILSFGLPVHSKFKCHYTKSELKKELNLNPNMKHILIMGGSMGAGNLLETTLELAKNLLNVEFTVICGHNNDLFEKLKRNNLSKNVNLLSFSDSIDKLMNISDILITKPGGLTSTEAMVENLPMIMINPIPGVESANCEFFNIHKMALPSNSIDETITICNLLLADIEISNELISSQKENVNPNAADDIAIFLIDKLNK
ncbi:glycosyltransferase [Clostridium sp. D53t1_180928_C8]|uniref:MGDG synthase family glycosyltransferase n=1 Tax=Clostridium sp. D53t1_180928_C8 TaxID=2787101 RepID=UPI0018AB4E3A|nr:glycosyltransferase [Clostridium sp. D53t1_180928_C8]